MPKVLRELISRFTALVVGLASLYGGWRCIAFGIGSSGEAHRGAGLPFMIGGALLVIGFPVTLFAVVPPGLLEKVFRPSAPRTGENGPDGDRPSLWWRLFDWW